MRLARKKNGDFVEVSVKDYGIGIPNGVLKIYFRNSIEATEVAKPSQEAGLVFIFRKLSPKIWAERFQFQARREKARLLRFISRFLTKINNNSASPDAKNIVIKNHGKML